MYNVLPETCPFSQWSASTLACIYDLSNNSAH